MTAVWIVVAIVVVCAFLGYRYYAAKKRREAFQAWARSRGWTYSERDDSFAERFDGTPFGQGDSREARNVVQGKHEGRPVIAFDYSYQTHSTDSKGNRTTTTHRFNVVAVGLPAALPTLQVASEGLFGSIGRALGFHDIELENEQFNKRFKVTSGDRKFAYDVLNPRTMELLMAETGPAWRIERGDLLGWERGRLEPALIERQLSFLCRLADGIPRFVWEEHKQSG